jgi:hypothetical protein
MITNASTSTQVLEDNLIQPMVLHYLIYKVFQGFIQVIDEARFYNKALSVRIKLTLLYNWKK